ncbi:hypothetical protein [uncultured Tateyamaria sp.]|uniref:hypothetical protein n=1 Tax=uncultured Tateyamaria sp. TaxID=455651 RepID=UPI00261D59FB|nr:hypothetical protein [uncultured Tateyamaria sp.]
MAGQAPKKTFRLGAPPACSEQGQRTKTTSVGLFAGPQLAGLGVAHTDHLCLPTESCSAVFFVENAQQASQIKALFPDLHALCIIE